MEVSIAGKIIYFYGPFSMAMLNNQRVYDYYRWIDVEIDGYTNGWTNLV